MMAVAILATLSLSSCGSNNDGKASDNEQVSETPKSTELDIEGIKALVEKEATDVTSEDFDFLLDQAEVFANKTKGMSKEEIDTYTSNLSEDETGAMIFISMALDAAKKGKKLSESQLQRYEEMKANDPTKK